MPFVLRTGWLSARLATVVLVGIAWTSCGPTQRTERPPEEDGPTQLTGLGPNDVFEVRVYGETELTGKFRVEDDGTIEYPFIGRMNVQGMSPSQIADQIAQRLIEGHYYRNPQVSLFVEEYNSRRVSVVGAVKQPGTLLLIPGLTVVQAISQAGGFTPLASANDTVLTRRQGGELKRYRVRASDISEGEESDITLRPGDIIFVPERVF